MHDKNTFDRVGSLVLGTGSSQQSEQTEAEKRKYAKIWQIKIDKGPRLKHDREEAEDYLGRAQKMDYDTMFQRKGGDAKKIEDEPEGPKADRTDDQILTDINK